MEIVPRKLSRNLFWRLFVGRCLEFVQEFVLIFVPDFVRKIPDFVLEKVLAIPYLLGITV
jgi:hypothetical protein